MKKSSVKYKNKTTINKKELNKFAKTPDGKKIIQEMNNLYILEILKEKGLITKK